MTPPPVLVTDGEQRAALAVVRSLGRAGVPVHLASTRLTPLAGVSRWVRSVVVVPDPLSSPNAFADAVLARADALQAVRVLPVAEASLLALRSRTDAPRILAPSLAAFRAVADKAQVLDVARRIGIRVPRQVVVDSVTTIDAALAALPEGPVVLKPARSIGEAAGRRDKFGVGYAASVAECARELVLLPAAAFPVLLQERVYGPGVGVFLLRWNGSVVARFAHRRLRERPPSGGVSVLSESIAAAAAPLVAAERLLSALDFEGVAMVEFKVDVNTNEPVLMEINGRFWGSLQLAIDCGVDFPRLLLACADGVMLGAPAMDWPAGRRLRWWWGDVDALIMALRRSEPASARLGMGRLAALAEFVKPKGNTRHETFRWADPKPFFRETRQWCATTLLRRPPA